MKIITTNKLNRLWENGIIAKMVGKSRVLNTAEEISANTNAENVTGALATKELINNLGGYSFGETPDGEPGYRKPGADTVIPFSNGLVEYIDGGMVRKTLSTDVASLSKSYTATSKGTLLIFCSITYTRSMSNTTKLNGAQISPSYTKTAGGTYIALYNIPVKKGDSVALSLSATNTANYDIHTSYFMVIIR